MNPTSSSLFYSSRTPNHKKKLGVWGGTPREVPKWTERLCEIKITAYSLKKGTVLKEMRSTLSQALAAED